MDNEKELLDFSLDDIMQQLQEVPAEQSAAQNTAEIAAILSNLDAPADIAEDVLETDVDSAALEQAQLAFSEAAEEVYAEAADEALLTQLPENSAPVVTDAETVRLDELAFSQPAPEVTEEPTARITLEKPAEPAAPKAATPQKPKTIPLARSARLRDLKRKLVSGPEKRYYALSEMGVGKLQLSIILNLIILALCGFALFLYAQGSAKGHLKLMIFSQVLAMMVSGLLGCNLLIDGLNEMFHLRYSLNSTLAISFIACCADAWIALDQQIVPFCAVFVLQMTMALVARYHSRTTEMAQLDTMRKANNLTSLVKEPKFYDKRAAILRGQGDVEDFTDTYTRISGPETVQRVYAFIALIASIGIAVLAGYFSSADLASGTFAGGNLPSWALSTVKENPRATSLGVALLFFSTSLMVSTPAGYFIALTRPAALLQKRLHMVGAVICGWQGVKKLCGKAVVPLRDKDLFPRGSTKLNGIKFYSDRTPAEVVSYTSSLIFEAGGGLVPLFRNLLASRNGTEYEVENFRDYGRGGIGGEVNGEPVLLGNLEFLQDMGVEIPQGTMVSQAVYVSIDGQLAAVIAISYAKMRSAAAGIVSLCGCRKLKTLLLAGDFMMTDNFIRSKFSIRTRRLILPPQEVRAELAARKADPEADVLALVTRDDLISTAYTITGAMSLRSACRMGTVIGILGGIIGLMILTVLACLKIDYTAYVTPVNVIVYQLIWLIPSLLATEWTRVV